MNRTRTFFDYSDNIGKFYIEEHQFKNNPIHFFNKIFKDMVILKSTKNIEDGSIKFIAVGPMFEKRNGSERIPKYKIVLTKCRNSHGMKKWDVKFRKTTSANEKATIVKIDLISDTTK